MYTVYVLKSDKDGNWYIGCTNDLKKRIALHNAGKVRSTKARVPFKLIHAEVFKDKHVAYFTERMYKTAKGKKILQEKIK